MIQLENAIHRLDNMLDSDYSTYPQIVDLLEEAYCYNLELNTTLLKQWEVNHLLTCLAEECGEVMELIYLEPNNKKKIEQEMNDIIGVAHILYSKDIICADLNPVEVSHRNNCNHPLFRCIKDIQYFSHKAIRFGLLDAKPNSLKRNIDELKYLLHTLVSLISASNRFSLWENHDTKVKKVLKYLDYAKRTTLGIHDNIQRSETF